MAIRKHIRVEFIDVETGAMIGYDEQPAKNLPETFEYTTRVEIKGQKFEVVKAEPNHRKKYKKSRLLVLEVKEIRPEVAVEHAAGSREAVAETAAEPQGPVTYEQPSRADVFPAFSDGREGKDLFEIGMDQWRSVELLREAAEQDVLVEMSRIEVSAVNHKLESEAGTRYRMQHRRSMIHTPFKEVGMEANDLRREFFPFAMGFDGLTFKGAEGFAEGSFALRTAGGIGLYGLEIRGQIVCMGVDLPREKQLSLIRPDLNRLLEFMRSKNLVLVDWGNFLVFHPDAEGLEALFGIAEEVVTEGEGTEEVAVTGEVALVDTATAVPATVVAELSIEPEAESDVEEPAEPQDELPNEVLGVPLTASIGLEEEVVKAEEPMEIKEEFSLETMPMQEFSIRDEEE